MIQISNRPKLIRTKLPLSVAAVKAENERRAALPDEGENKLEQLPSDRASRRRMRRRMPLVGLIAQAQHQRHEHDHG